MSTTVPGPGRPGPARVDRGEGPHEHHRGGHGPIEAVVPAPAGGGAGRDPSVTVRSHAGGAPARPPGRASARALHGRGFVRARCGGCAAAVPPAPTLPAPPPPPRSPGRAESCCARSSARWCARSGGLLCGCVRAMRRMRGRSPASVQAGGRAPPQARPSARCALSRELVRGRCRSVAAHPLPADVDEGGEEAVDGHGHGRGHAVGRRQRLRPTCRKLP
jgi:hypothetical protein